MLKQCLDAWRAQGRPWELPALIAAAEACRQIPGTVNVDAPPLLLDGDMPSLLNQQLHAADEEYGIQIVDIRIRRFNYPPQVQETIFARIRSERGKTEGIIPRHHQSRAERYSQGDRIKAVIADVHTQPKGPQVVLSRTDPRLLIKLFEMEVP